MLQLNCLGTFGVPTGLALSLETSQARSIVNTTVNRLLERLRQRVHGICDVSVRFHDHGPHGVLKLSYALRSDGIWRTAVFSVALEGFSPLDQRRGVAEIFECIEQTIISGAFSPTSSRFA